MPSSVRLEDITLTELCSMVSASAAVPGVMKTSAQGCFSCTTGKVPKWSRCAWLKKIASTALGGRSLYCGTAAQPSLLGCMPVSRMMPVSARLIKYEFEPISWLPDILVNCMCLCEKLTVARRLGVWFSRRLGGWFVHRLGGWFSHGFGDWLSCRFGGWFNSGVWSSGWCDTHLS